MYISIFCTLYMAYDFTAVLFFFFSFNICLNNFLYLGSITETTVGV